MAEELKPCPFCGGEARPDRVLRDGCKDGEPDAWAYFLRCISCAAQGPWFKTAGNATRAWNTRAAPREPGGDMVRRADVLAAIREASVHYEAGHESWLVSPHRLSETIQVLAAPRPDAGDGTGEPI